jgi:hypothetical protein
MATSVTSRTFLGTGIVIDERIVEIQQGASAVLGLASAGFAKVRLIFAQIRPGMAPVIDGLYCTVCKLAVKTIVSAILVHIGVPPLPGGD